MPYPIRQRSANAGRCSPTGRFGALQFCAAVCLSAITGEHCPTCHPGTLGCKSRADLTLLLPPQASERMQESVQQTLCLPPACHLTMLRWAPLQGREHVVGPLLTSLPILDSIELAEWLEALCQQGLLREVGGSMGGEYGCGWVGWVAWVWGWYISASRACCVRWAAWGVVCVYVCSGGGSGVGGGVGWWCGGWGGVGRWGCGGSRQAECRVTSARPASHNQSRTCRLLATHGGINV